MANMELTKEAVVLLRRDLGILMELLVNNDATAAQEMSDDILGRVEDLDDDIQGASNMTLLP